VSASGKGAGLVQRCREGSVSSPAPSRRTAMVLAQGDLARLDTCPHDCRGQFPIRLIRSDCGHVDVSIANALCYSPPLSVFPEGRVFRCH
jgi:hypothetical protein